MDPVAIVVILYLAKVPVSYRVLDAQARLGWKGLCAKAASELSRIPPCNKELRKNGAPIDLIGAIQVRRPPINLPMLQFVSPVF